MVIFPNIRPVFYHLPVVLLSLTMVQNTWGDIKVNPSALKVSLDDKPKSATETKAPPARTVATGPTGKRIEPTISKQKELSIDEKRQQFLDKFSKKGPNFKKNPPPAPKIIPRSQPVSPGTYHWRINITATVFWIGETPTANNPTPNNKSSWDASWMTNFGGFDNPDPTKRCVNFCPKDFTPKQNPFYVALPYNDVSKGSHKPEAARIIPWFKRDFTQKGKSVCKGKWVQIVYKGKYCFAQWEDCGPFTTDDWHYVFGDKPPSNTNNYGAAIDISPAVRDYLGIPGGYATVSWRFVDFHRIPQGPWSKLGDNNPFVNQELKPATKAQPKQMTREQWLQRQRALRRELQG